MKAAIKILLHLLIFGSLQSSVLSQKNEILTAILHNMKEQSVFSDSVNWKSIEPIYWEISNEYSGDSSVIMPTEYLFEALGDFHGGLLYKQRRYNSFFKSDYIYPMDMSIYQTIQNRGLDIATEIIQEDIGYIRIPLVSTYDPSELQRIGNQLRDSICEIKHEVKSGWIIDLRTNTGGNMYPMFAGIGALFPTLDLGGDTQDGVTYNTRWSLRNGDFYLGNNLILELDKSCLSEVNANEELPVVVLISRFTSSSGEAVASGLKGHKNISLVGEVTSGYSSATGWVPITDDIILMPVVSYFRSINGENHFEGIHPDFEIVEKLELDLLTVGDMINKAISIIKER